MIKTSYSIDFLSFNLLFTILSFLAYNGIFLTALFAVTGFSLPFITIISILLILLFTAGNLLLWRFTAKPLAICLLMINSFCLYFMNTYHISIDKIMLLNTFETDIAEAEDIFNFKLVLYMIIGGILPSLLIYRLRICFLPWPRELLRRCILILTALILICVIVFPNYKYTAQFLRNNRSLKYQLLPVNYVGAVISAVKIIRKSNRELIPIGLDAVFTRYWNNDKPNLLVVVIGETARAQNFSLGGYFRDTNHDLAPWRKELLYFPNTSSCGTSTAVSLPCIFSAQTRRKFKPGSESFTENLLDIFNRSGYHVLWRENNSGCKNNCDRIETETFCQNYACKDEVLLKNFIPKIKSFSGNSLVILHQQGSHGPSYYKRYPPAFERYKPVCQTEDLSRCQQSEIINAYDNSIAYTSFVLAQTIQQLQKLSVDYNVSMLFVSDHGESLGENGIYLHAAPYLIAPKEQTRVPMFLWLNSANADALKIDLDCARRQTLTAWSHDNIFHTLLGLGGIKTSEYDPELDILSRCRKK